MLLYSVGALGRSDMCLQKQRRKRIINQTLRNRILILNAGTVCLDFLNDHKKGKSLIHRENKTKCFRISQIKLFHISRGQKLQKNTG